MALSLSTARRFLRGFRLLSGDDVNNQLVDKLNAVVSALNGTTVDIAATGLVVATNDAVTAFAGGGQTNATQLTGGSANVTTVGTAADSVKLPLATAGAVFFLRNSGANSMQVFGAGTDTINGVATATGVAQAAGTSAFYFCTKSAAAGKWYRVLSA